MSSSVQTTIKKGTKNVFGGQVRGRLFFLSFLHSNLQRGGKAPRLFWISEFGDFRDLGEENLSPLSRKW